MVLPVVDTLGDDGACCSGESLFPARKTTCKKVKFPSPRSRRTCFLALEPQNTVEMVDSFRELKVGKSKKEQKKEQKKKQKKEHKKERRTKCVGYIPRDIGSISSVVPLPIEKRPFPGLIESITPGNTDEPYWNHMFQQITQNLSIKTDKTTQTYRFQQLSSLVKDFSETAQTFAKIIIDEFHLPDEKKTVAPHRTLGGEAGGDKYLHHGILFKMAKSPFSSLDISDAMKIAGHEIKALNSVLRFIEKTGSQLCFPLMTLVDYNGHRVLACSQLPIDKNTLLYGTSNAKTVHFGNEYEKSKPLSSWISQLGKSCNLGPNSFSAKNTIFFTPLDLEGHLGNDERQYFVDMARLFPPVHYNRDIDSTNIQFLYQLFRPEFVQSYYIPNVLVSDSISPFISPESKVQSTMHLEQATSYLMQRVIPLFSGLLAQQPVTKSSVAQLIPTIHRQGINIRYIGIIYNFLQKQNPEWADKLLIEMAARTFKSILNAKFRSVVKNIVSTTSTTPRTSILAEVTISLLNRMLSANNIQTWHEKFAIIFEKFPGCELEWNCFAQRLSCSQFRRDVFSRVQQIICVQFTESSKLQFDDSQQDFFARQDPFHSIHILDFIPIVKNLVVMDHYKGLVLKREAKQYKGTPTIEKSLLKEAASAFKDAFESNPSEISCILQIADVYYKLKKNEKAREYFSLAVRMTNDPIAKYKCARFCHKTGASETGMGYQQAIAADPQSFRTWFHFSEFLVDTKEPFETVFMSLAATFFLCPESEFPKLEAFIQNYASVNSLQIADFWKRLRNEKPEEVSSYWNQKLTQ